MIPYWCRNISYLDGDVVLLGESVYKAVKIYEREPHTGRNVKAININLNPADLVGWVELEKKEIEA